MRAGVQGVVLGNYLAVPTFVGSKMYDDGLDGDCGCN